MNKKSIIIVLFVLSVFVTLISSNQTLAVFEIDLPPDSGGSGDNTEYYTVKTGYNVVLSNASFSDIYTLGYNQPAKTYEIYARVTNQKSYYHLEDCEKLYIKIEDSAHYTYNRYYEIEDYVSSKNNVGNSGMYLVDDYLFGLTLYTRDYFSNFLNNYTYITEDTYSFNIFNVDKYIEVVTAEFNDGVIYHINNHYMFAYLLIESDDLNEGMFFMNGFYDEENGFSDYVFINSNYFVEGNIYNPGSSMQFASVEFYTFSSQQFNNVVGSGDNVQYISGVYLFES